MIKENDQKKVLLKTYLASRRIIKFCKYLGSDRIMKNLILFTLAEKPKTIRELSQLFSVRHSWMSATIGILEKKGHVSKKKLKDPRFKSVALTPLGEKAEKEIEGLMATHCKLAFSGMSPKEIEQLGDLAVKVKTDYKKTDLYQKPFQL